MHCAGETVEVQGRYAFAVDDGNAYLAAGLAGLGVLWLPDYMAKMHLASGELLPPLRESHALSERVGREGPPRQ